MSLLMFEGPAGTGKTTRLLAAARDYLGGHPLDLEQRVLALTKYHGSRRRMEAKLRGREAGVGNALDCVTIDSFAWNLVGRWKSLADHLDLRPEQGDFASITSAAGVLLQQPTVAKWVARRYPLVIVDEMQDCKQGEVQVLGGLEPYVRVLCGADAFQDLSGDAGNEAIAWATSVGKVIPLTQVHRTNTAGLLAAAHALRNGGPVVSDKGAGFEVAAVAATGQGGAAVCWRIFSWARHGEIAVVSATARGTSPFCDQVVEWASSKGSTAKKTGTTAGPYPTPWESGDDEAKRAVLESLGLPGDATATIRCTDLAARAETHGVRDVVDWVRRLRFVLGRVTVTGAEVAEEVGHIVRRRRAFGPTRSWRRQAMTIHQAKNREFESVIVLWPLKLAGSLERKRRLLYNAVTRAKGRAIVIVQDPRGLVLNGPLFTGNAEVMA